MNTLFAADADKATDDIIARVSELASLPRPDLIDAINRIRTSIHEISPFKNEPVDCVLWVKAETVEANDYNPNTVAPPEMKLLAKSIEADGFTQPVVSHMEDGRRETVDGFHRGRIGKENAAVRERTLGYLPVVTIRSERGSREDRIAATVRHNRARGKHGVESMSSLVAELSKKGWAPDRIGKELGMDADEVLRLRQITGLAELFADREFSEAWAPVPKKRKPRTP